MSEYGLWVAGRPPLAGTKNLLKVIDVPRGSRGEFINPLPSAAYSNGKLPETYDMAELVTLNIREGRSANRLFIYDTFTAIELPDLSNPSKISWYPERVDNNHAMLQHTRHLVAILVWRVRA